MALDKRSKDLLAIAKAQKDTIQQFRRGAFMERTHGATIDTLRLEALAARWSMTLRFRREALAAVRGSAKNYRLAVNRFYYAMYHAMRAVVYLEYDGDDYQDHSTLHTKEVRGFGVATWQNTLKNARLQRNVADYEPYPAGDVSFKKIATDLKADANLLLAAARTYLRGKGCRIR